MKPRRMFISAEHSTVKKLSARESKYALGLPIKGRTDIVQRASKWHTRGSSLYSASMTLGHLLYPKWFPEQVASSVVKSAPSSVLKDEMATSFSREARLTKKSQQGIEAHYGYREKVHAPGKKGQSPTVPKAYTAHERSLDAKAYRIMDRIERGGIRVDRQAVHVGKTKTGYVFFEIEQLHIPMLKATINALPERTSAQRLKKKQAILLLEYLDSRKGIDGRIQRPY